MEAASKDVLVTLAGTAQLKVPVNNSCWNIAFVHNYQSLFKLRLSSQVRAPVYACSKVGRLNSSKSFSKRATVRYCEFYWQILHPPRWLIFTDNIRDKCKMYDFYNLTLKIAIMNLKLCKSARGFIFPSMPVPLELAIIFISVQ
jgi:hypothetical protein